ncbi:MAG: ABC transporter permease, partial [Pseudomonadota bacterium]
MNATRTETLVEAAPPQAARGRQVWRQLLRDPSVMFGGAVMLAMILLALVAPFLHTLDPAAINPVSRNLQPGAESPVELTDGQEVEWVHWMGTDSLGRDVYSRVIYGARVSLLVGIVVAALSIVVGLVIGMVAGYIR